MDQNNPKPYAELLARVAMKDRNAFEILYKETSMKLYGLLIRICKREDLAQECLQDAYVSIWNKADEYREGVAAPITWMTSIARYRALDLLRKRKHESSLEGLGLEDQTADTKANLEKDLLNKETAGEIGNCLKRLEEKQRVCIYLAYYDGLTQGEIATHINAPIGSVKTWIRRGMVNLKGCLAS